MAVSFMLPPNPPHSLQLQWREREQLPTHSAERVVVVIEDPLVTVFVTDVCQSSQFAAVHVSKDVLILAPLVTLVTGDLPFCVKNSGQENHIAGLSNHRFAKYLHCSAARHLFTDPLFLVSEMGVSATQNKNLLQNFVLKHLHMTNAVTVVAAITEPVHRINYSKSERTFALTQEKSIKSDTTSRNCH